MPARDSGVRVVVSGATDSGRVRAHNEDSFAVCDLTALASAARNRLAPGTAPDVMGPKGLLLMVADGLGGAAAGEVASNVAIDRVRAHMMETWCDARSHRFGAFKAQLSRAVHRAHEAVRQIGDEDPECAGMGSTLTAVGLLGDRAQVVQVGDSRAYLVRGVEMHRLTRDQNYAAELSPEAPEDVLVDTNLGRAITQAVGLSDPLDVQESTYALRRGDSIVVCTDGLTTMVSDPEILGFVLDGGDPSAVTSDLIDTANARGGPDNITVIVARLDGPSLPADF